MLDRLVHTLTVRDIDQRLAAMRQALHDALDVGDLDSVDACYEALDDLLDRRNAQGRS